MKEQNFDLTLWANSLTYWRENKNISIESQRKEFFANLCKIIGELGEAVADKKNSKNEIVKAICDIINISINVSDVKGDDKYTKHYLNIYVEEAEIGVEDTDLAFELLPLFLSKAMELAFGIQELGWRIMLQDLIPKAVMIVEYLGYDFNLVMNEMADELKLLKRADFNKARRQ